MFVVERALGLRGLRGVRAVQLALVAAMVAAVGAVTLSASPAGAVEIYPRPSSSTLTISGHGYGHGHGMSQWGAYGAATHGRLSWQSILAFYYPGTRLQNLGNQSIRVRLDAVGSGPLYVVNAAGLRLAGRSLPGPATGVTQYRARPTSAGLQIDKLSAGHWLSYSAAASPAVFTSTSGLVSVLLSGGARRAYRGSIDANRASSTSVRTVSVLPMESYLRAVVPAEMPASWAPNAVRAQAVAARSYASYDRAHASAGRNYDTCDTTSCQMYSGVPAESGASDAAIAATAGQTLTYGGSAAFTQFGSANGGWTAAGSQPYLPAKADPYDGAIANDGNTWKTSITAARIQATWPSIGTYRQLRIISRDGNGQWGGRVQSLAIDGSNGSVSVSGGTFASAFGLRSEWFIPTNAGSAPAFPRDFNADGNADVVGVGVTSGALRLYAGDGAAGWKSTSVIGTGFGGFSKVFTAGTWDRDSISDVMAVAPDGTLWLYPGTAQGPLAPGRRIGSGWGAYNLIVPVGDFSGDGYSDLVARTSAGVLMLFRGDGSGGFLRAGKIGTGWGGFTSVFGTGDFNGDHKADVIARTSAGLLYLYPGNGSGGWLPPRRIGQGWNAFSTIISSGDFNGDRTSDLLARSTAGTLWLYPGDGTGHFLAAKAVGTGWDNLSVLLP